MTGRRAYLDYNASAPLLDAARSAMVEALALSGNPSSVHSEGRKTRQLVETARRQIAMLVNTKPEHVVFTSGATEAAATVLTPDWQMGRSHLRMSRLFVCATDHPCVLSGGRFESDQVTQIGVDGQGVLNIEALRDALGSHNRDTGLALVAIHAVHNETGVIQPVKEISELVRLAGGVFALDAAQAGGRIEIDLAAGMADYIMLSSHKMGGPKGIGAIAAASDLMMPKPLVTGGGQEKGHRAGTENPAAIAGFGAAAEAAGLALQNLEQIRAKRDELEKRILEICPEAIIYGSATKRAANTTFFSVPGIKAETAQIAFDLAGVALSAGSACSSGKVGPSHALTAMGYGESNGALRVSLGAGTTDDDIEHFTQAFTALMARRDASKKAA